MVFRCDKQEELEVYADNEHHGYQAIIMEVLWLGWWMDVVITGSGLNHVHDFLVERSLHGEKAQ